MLARIFIAILFIFPCEILHAKYQSSVAIANVNNKAITLFDLQDRYNFLTKIMKIKVVNSSEKEIFFSQIIDKMVDEELIRQEAVKLQIIVDENEVSGVLESLATRKKQSLESFKREFIQKNISFENYKNQIRTDLLWSKIVAGSLKSRIKITDLEIKEFYEQQKLETDITKYFIAEIFIPKSKDTKLLAQKLVDELKNGADFTDIVKQFSRSPSSDNNGEIGWVSKGDIDDKIYQAIHNLPKKSYSDPIFLNDGYHIFRLLDKKSVVEIKDDDVIFAKNRIFMQRLETEGRGYLMELHKKSFIEVYRDRINLD